jgi:hypothetical protein
MAAAYTYEYLLGRMMDGEGEGKEGGEGEARRTMAGRHVA